MNICVFGSSSDNINKAFLDSAESLGKAIAKKGHTMVFGAGKYGVMGASARGVSAEGGKLVGVSPTFFIEMNVLYDECTEIIYTETMRERKAIMEDMSDAFVVCGGGMGTFEEFFEVLTLKQLHQHTKPIIIYNVNGYYDPMIEMLRHAVNEKFMTDDCMRLYTVANNEEELFEQLESYVPYSYDKYDYIYAEEGENNG